MTLELQAKAFWPVASVLRGRPVGPLSKEMIEKVMRQSLNSENEHLRKMANEVKYDFQTPGIVPNPIVAFFDGWDRPSDSGDDVA